MYCYALSYCDMCGRLPFFTEYNSGVPAPQRADSALSLQCTLSKEVVAKVRQGMFYISYLVTNENKIAAEHVQWD